MTPEAHEHHAGGINPTTLRCPLLTPEEQLSASLWIYGTFIVLQ